MSFYIKMIITHSYIWYIQKSPGTLQQCLGLFHILFFNFCLIKTKAHLPQSINKTFLIQLLPCRQRLKFSIRIFQLLIRSMEAIALIELKSANSLLIILRLQSYRLNINHNLLIWKTIFKHGQNLGAITLSAQFFIDG